MEQCGFCAYSNLNYVFAKCTQQCKFITFFIVKDINGLEYTEFFGNPTKTQKEWLHPNQRSTIPKIIDTGRKEYSVRLFKLFFKATWWFEILWTILSITKAKVFWKPMMFDIPQCQW